MRTKICAELATGHGGSVDLACRMIDAAAGAGCDAVKIQHYGSVNPKDPQAAWLEQSRLTPSHIADCVNRAHWHGMKCWATPFDAASLRLLTEIGVDRIKIASSEAHASWWDHRIEDAVVSWPWGIRRDDAGWSASIIHLATVPLYPTPLECVYRVPISAVDGWSDHAVGLSACQHAISLGATWVEAHLTLGEGQSRVLPFDKTPEQFAQLRQFAEDVETMRTGVGQTFRNRWVRS